MVVRRTLRVSRAVSCSYPPFEPIEKDDEASGECEGGDEIEQRHGGVPLWSGGGRRGVRVVVERRAAGHLERAVVRLVCEFERHFPEHLAVCCGNARDVPLRGARAFRAVTVRGASRSDSRVGTTRRAARG
jgi:hypothetical protein